MKFETLLYEKEGKIATIVINRPDRLNAINFTLFGEMVRAIDEVERDDDVNAVILKGAGTSFSVGADLNDVYNVYGDGASGESGRRPSQRARLHKDRYMLEVFRRILYCWKPVIAQVHGYCIGIGLYMVQACDMAIAADDAKIGHREQRLAFGGATFMLVNEMIQIGPKKTRELLLTGKFIDGKEAERIGMVNKSVPLSELEAEVKQMAEVVALLPRDAIAIGKSQTCLAYDTLGFGANINQAFIGHTMATNIRFEEGEYNFIKERKLKGSKEAFHERDKRWEKLEK